MFMTCCQAAQQPQTHVRTAYEDWCTGILTGIQVNCGAVLFIFWVLHARWTPALLRAVPGTL